jgi:type VI secretion system protein ImpM
MNPDAPGYFGKVPARGDFLSCRMPPTVAEPWDAWLGMLTVAVREESGADWPDVWLTAPLWHFALAPGIMSDRGAAGVLVASADRVGRLFPFTIIGPSGGVPEESWSGEAERLVLEALDDGFDPAVLDAALTTLDRPFRPTPIGAGTTVWWCRGSDIIPPTRNVVRGMPGRAAAVAMVLGERG